MISILDVSKSYGSQVLFDSVSLTLGRGERVGIVGRNGHGKSTLFRIILGEEDADSGTVRIPNGYRIGCLSQHLEFHLPSALEEAEAAIPADEGGWKPTHIVEEVLHGLGFSAESMRMSPALLSGGFQIRINLAKLLLSEADLLLLDEPTNYLDIVSLRWLANFLRSWRGELLIITHDRSFMDSVVTHIAGIHRQNLRKIPGTTEKYYSQIALEESVHEQTRLNQEKKRAVAEQFVERFRAKASKAKAVQSRVKALEREEVLEKLDSISQLAFSFREAPFPGKILLDAQRIHFGYDAPLIKDFSLSVRKGDRIAIIGPNGKGKSTLLRLLAGELTPQKGDISKSANTQLAYFGQTNVQRLHPKLTVEEEILNVVPDKNLTTARNICGLMMFSGDNALKKISVLSGGERSRVSLGKIIATQTNLLLLDEPTNHLDMDSSNALEDALAEFEGAFVIVTHSEGMIRRLASRLVVFDGDKLFNFEGSYDDFLARIGWCEEEPVVTKPAKTTTSKKEQRRLRNEYLKNNPQQAAKIEALEKRITTIEKQIIDFEKKVADGNAKLIESSQNGFGDAEAKMARELHQLRERIEKLFEELDGASKEKETINSEIDLAMGIP